MGHTILVTGASGLLGSALCVDLSRDYKIIGLYRRPLPERLKKAASLVQWEKSLAGGKIAYSKSKALGEKMLFENSYRVPVVVLHPLAAVPVKRIYFPLFAGNPMTPFP